MTAARASRGGGITERVVLLFLVAASLVLGWIYLGVMPSERIPEALPFDLRNPLLDARLGECVQIESTSTQGGVVCLKVREPGVVLRPRDGPPQLGIYGGLRRGRPYLATGLRYPPPGVGCEETGALREEIELFDLNAFGMPYGLDVTVDAVRPLWVQRGGRFLFVYEVQLTQYGAVGRTWFVDVHPDAPVAGIVRRRHSVEGGTETAIFLRVDDCP